MADDPHLIDMPEEEAVDVDTELEFQFAELLWQRRNGSGQDVGGVEGKRSGRCGRSSRRKVRARRTST